MSRLPGHVAVIMIATAAKSVMRTGNGFSGHHQVKVGKLKEPGRPLSLESGTSTLCVLNRELEQA